MASIDTLHSPANLTASLFLLFERDLQGKNVTWQLKETRLKEAKLLFLAIQDQTQ